MNHTYRLLWNHARNAWIVVGETARSQSKNTSRALVAATAILSALTVQAGPSGGQVTAGDGSISQAGAVTTINQQSQNLNLNWQSFNVAAHETVNFVQPSATATAVNRILDTNGSQIMGNINANGQVYLINPNGILFGQNAQVNVGALVASTLDTNTNLSSGTQVFAGTGQGSIDNQGLITASNGGFVALIGNQLSNQGTITTPEGTTALGAGNKVSLTFTNNQLLDLQVDESVLNSQTENGGVIKANGGIALLSAGAKDALVASVVNNTGLIQAQSVSYKDGNIVLLAGMKAGQTNVSGTLDASAPAVGNGGFIETSGARVSIHDDAVITTVSDQGESGTWLIDPVDFSIAASGGDMTGATLTTNLTKGNVIIQSVAGDSGTAGDLNVNDTVSWSANKLTLNAQNDINVTANMTAIGTASLALEYGQAAAASGNTSKFTVKGGRINLPAGDSSFTTKQGNNGSVKTYEVITSLGQDGRIYANDLQGMHNTKNYALGADIDASDTKTWAKGFTPITDYYGILDGLGNVISNLYFDSNIDMTGLFRHNSGVIRNIKFHDAEVKGTKGATALVAGKSSGAANYYNIELKNINVTNLASNIAYVAILSGKVERGIISDVHIVGDSSITSQGKEVGSLAGFLLDAEVDKVSSNAFVSGINQTGGLVGRMIRGNLNEAKFTGEVVGKTETNGGTEGTGGLVGYFDRSTISNSYSTGSVKAHRAIGGLVGKMLGSTSITNSYATGLVTATSDSATPGGLVGYKAGGTITSSYWDTTTSELNSSAGGLGFSTSAMKNIGTYAGWDFDQVWNAPTSTLYPTLKGYKTPLTVTVSSLSKVYDSNVYSSGYTVTYSGFTGSDSASDLGGSVVYGGSAATATDVGSHTITASGLTSSKYSFNYVAGKLNINKAPLTISGLTGADRVYNGSTAASLSGEANVSAFGSDVVTLTGTPTVSFIDKHVGTGKAITVTGYSLAGADSDNYILTQPSDLTADITPYELQLSGLSVEDKKHDGGKGAKLNGTALIASPLDGEVVQLAGTGEAAFSDSKAGKNLLVSLSGYRLAGQDASNYKLILPTNLTASIEEVEQPAQKVVNRLLASLKRPTVVVRNLSLALPAKSLSVSSPPKLQAGQQGTGPTLGTANANTTAALSVSASVSLGGSGSAFFMMGDGVNISDSAVASNEE